MRAHYQCVPWYIRVRSCESAGWVCKTSNKLVRAAHARRRKRLFLVEVVVMLVLMETLMLMPVVVVVVVVVVNTHFCADCTEAIVGHQITHTAEQSASGPVLFPVRRLRVTVASRPCG